MLRVNPNKKLILVVLVFTLVMQGCSFLGLDLEEERAIAVQKSPYMIVMEGDLQKEDYIAVAQMLKFLGDTSYKDSNFTAWHLDYAARNAVLENKSLGTPTLLKTETPEGE